MPATGPPTILFEVFWTQQKRKRLIEVALEGIELPPEDYPFYVTIGADGPLTPRRSGRPRSASQRRASGPSTTIL